MPRPKIKSTAVVKKLMKCGVPLVALKARRLPPGKGNTPSHSIYIQMMEKPTSPKIYKLVQALSDFAHVKLRKIRYHPGHDLFLIYFYAWTDYRPGDK